jgi:UDP-glucose 4-epimerase
MNILVTGGAGFLGSHLVDKLLELKHKVVVIDNLSTGKKRYLHGGDFYKIDIKSPMISTVFKKHKFDLVFHLAAQKSVPHSIADPKFDAQENIIGSLNLLENCKKHNIKKFIFVSSGGAIYDDADQYPTTEKAEPKPLTPYAIAKFSIEKYVNFYSKVHQLKYTILRPSNIFGPRQDPYGEAGVIAIFISNLLTKKKCYINGQGNQSRDFVYVQDVVSALIKGMKTTNKTYNIATAKDISILKLYQKVEELIGTKRNFETRPAIKGEVKKSQLSYQRIKKDLNWKPKYSLEKGIQETIEYFKNN